MGTTGLRSPNNSGPNITQNSNSIKTTGTVYSRARTVQLSTSQRDLNKPTFSANQIIKPITKNNSDSGMERNSNSHEVTSDEIPFGDVLTDSSSNNRTPSSNDDIVLGPSCNKNCMIYGHSDVCWTKKDYRHEVLGQQTSIQSSGSNSSRDSKRQPVLRPARKSGLISSL